MSQRKAHRAAAYIAWNIRQLDSTRKYGWVRHHLAEAIGMRDGLLGAAAARDATENGRAAMRLHRDLFYAQPMWPRWVLPSMGLVLLLTVINLYLDLLVSGWGVRTEAESKIYLYVRVSFLFIFVFMIAFYSIRHYSAKRKKLQPKQVADALSSALAEIVQRYELNPGLYEMKLEYGDYPNLVYEKQPLGGFTARPIGSA